MKDLINLLIATWPVILLMGIVAIPVVSMFVKQEIEIEEPEEAISLEEESKEGMFNQ